MRPKAQGDFLVPRVRVSATGEKEPCDSDHSTCRVWEWHVLPLASKEARDPLPRHTRCCHRGWLRMEMGPWAEGKSGKQSCQWGV